MSEHLAETDTRRTAVRPPRENGQRVLELAKQAGTGDIATRRELRQALQERWDIWGPVAELEEDTREMVLRNVARKEDALVRDLYSEHLERLRTDLLGTDSSPLRGWLERSPQRSRRGS
jgi:hypothetical protein